MTSSTRLKSEVSLRLTEREANWLLESVIPILQDTIENCKEGQVEGIAGLSPAKSRRLIWKILALPPNNWAKSKFKDLFDAPIAPTSQDAGILGGFS